MRQSPTGSGYSGFHFVTFIMFAFTARHDSCDNQYKDGKALGSGAHGHGSTFFTTVTVLDRFMFPEFNESAR
ncbi:hypothetical protein AYR66_09460 [Noviherbaspirillum denitrificans]|uniref:Uncharacterized protein n=1 Tax=Noviherbaspirillum denitrificans TaxID=1968433 RepID=A0A254TGM9_9BURK|nr:hypothetical protein AYR66_09460 [Noviherbaspirillum denitrificans]